MRTLLNLSLVLVLGIVSLGKAWAQPVITTQPVNQTARIGDTVTFSVTATSANPPINYQWQFNGTAIDMATGPSLVISSVGASQFGTYTVYVYDLVGGVTSAPATLSLNSTQPPPSINSAPTD